MNAREEIASKSGCSIPVVRVHGVDVDRVRFPAARQKNKKAPHGAFLFFYVAERANYFARDGNRKAFPYQVKLDGKVPAAVAEIPGSPKV